jgi:type II restriction/modification system DNA methylase subunit YeeA
MNTSKIKAYAPQARNDFIKAVTERANLYGIFDDHKIESFESKGNVAFIGDRPFSEKEAQLRDSLVSRVKQEGFQQVMEAYAYTWFNRFVALRYMEIHDYLTHGFRVLSNKSGSNIPEILENAADVEFEGLKKEKIIELRLDGDKDNELYRLLIVAQCNALYQSMPFLFDRVDSETELLLPDNLLHSNSPIQKLVQEIDEESWQDVEIIGWMYQFYISEKKDQVIGKVVKSEDIPAATQLFTPNWIVKYMVQNTLGRMWLATYPDSSLRDKMEYYIEPAEQEPDVQKELDRITPKELNPEEITFLDPACGSGHILIEAYAIFKEIYLERGYRTRDIPKLILEKNIFGLDICDRAAQLGCFAVLMKAREDDRRILERDRLKLNVMAIQEGASIAKIQIENFFRGEEYQDVRNILQELITIFEFGKTFGALIKIPEHIQMKIDEVKDIVDDKLDKWVSESGVQVLKKLSDQSWILAKKYDCVVSNPPYMGGKGMNPELKVFGKKCFPDSKSDLFAIFIERVLNLALTQGFVGMITMQSWMFLSSFEKLRKKLLNQKTLMSMAHLGARAFDSIGGEVVSTTSFIISNTHNSKYKGSYIRLVDGSSEAEKKKELIQKSNHYLSSAADFKKIPGSPIAYWVSEKVRKLFYNLECLGNIASPKIGMRTGDNERFLRRWFEINFTTIQLTNLQIKLRNHKKWVPYNKGGAYRKWYGNFEHIVNWENNGYEIKNNTILNYPQLSWDNLGWKISNESFYFQEGVTWTDLSSSFFGVRYLPKGFIFDAAGPCLFGKNPLFYLSFLSTKQCFEFLKILNPTLHFKNYNIASLPIIKNDDLELKTQDIATKIIEISKFDWNLYETSWNFYSFSLLRTEYRQTSIKHTYSKVRTHFSELAFEMQQLEKENNHIFIKAYDLQNELTPDVSLRDVTLTCNPQYRYGFNKTEEELEFLLKTDTIKELISYAIGCMMGRYSLDHPGLIYAHSGNIDFDPSKYKTFPADDDGIIPIMDQEWFEDDATNRFVEFLKVAWTPETLDENLKFVADSLTPKKNETSVDTIRRYISTNFFKDHLKTYKKRPIYWLFSSGKQKAFQCLVYLHRYNESTLARMRSAYVTPLQGNFVARIEFLQRDIDAESTASAKRKFQKEIHSIQKKLEELRKFDDELRHYSEMKISLDLDDGVKVNYGKFGNLLAEKKSGYREIIESMNI